MQFLVTFFSDICARDFVSQTMTLDELRRRVDETTAPSKDMLELFKLAEFGSHRTPAPANCLRNDDNVRSISGLVVDYNGEQMPLQEAIDRLEAYNLHFLAFTSPRHTPATPRWRLVLPTSQRLLPADHNRLMNGVNGVLGGVLGAENWSLSQSYYYGHVVGVPFEIYVSEDEQCIDEVDLDAVAQPFRPSDAGNGGGAPDYDNMDESELLEIIESGAHYWGPAKHLLTRWAQQSVSIPDAESNLVAAFDAVPQADRGKRWAKGKKEIPRWVRDVYKRLAKKQGAPLKALVAYLTDDPLWKGAVRFNEFNQTIEVCDPFPPQSGQVVTRYRALRDPGDHLRTLIQVQDHGFPKATQSAVWNALILAAEERAYHPVRDYLNSLAWNGDRRVSRLFLDYFPGEVPKPSDDAEKLEWQRLEADGKLTPAARMTAYLEEIATCYMVGLVARVFKPGCKVDTLPVLISAEAFNKSQGFRALCHDEAWFTDDVSPDLMDRDTKDSLRGKWLIELAEFPHARRDATRFKMFASRQVDRFRRPYDRAPHDWPRQCGFAATANELELISVTGNRRIWPFWLDGQVDVAAIERDRDQLWAETVHLYADNYPWWLPPTIEAIAGEFQDTFVEADNWDEVIIGWIELTFGKPPEEGKPDQRKIRFTVRQVLEKAFGYALAPKDLLNLVVATASDEKRVIRRLQRLGYRPDPQRRRTDAGRHYWIPLKK